MSVDSAIRDCEGSDKLGENPQEVVVIFHALFGVCVCFAASHAGWLVSWTQLLVPRKFQRCRDLWVATEKHTHT